VEAVPQFDDDSVISLWKAGIVYRGLYLAHQHIKSLPAAAFSSLPVTRIVLNFNNIEDNIHPDLFVGRLGDIFLQQGSEVDRNKQYDTVRSRMFYDASMTFENDWNTLESKAAGRQNQKIRRHAGNGVSLAGLTLNELFMGACKIRNLPRRLLHKLVNLKRLHLWANKIEILPPGLFLHNSKLVELSLWGNQIDELSADVFDGLRSLRYLDLDRNRLTSLTANGAISRLVSLVKLSLNGNRIHSLTYDLFQDGNSLKSLSLDSNGLGFVYGSTLRNLTNLSSLSIRRNAVHILPDDMFSGLGRLKELRLDYNLVERVWSRTFHGLHTLVRLWMTSNKLSQVPDGAFRESSKLRHLYLNDNNLTSFSHRVINHGSLGRLFLDGNPLCCDCKMVWIKALFRRGAVVSGACETRADSDERSPVSVQLFC
jgi:Leucine-rich repeat (LRR) protein